MTEQLPLGFVSFCLELELELEQVPSSVLIHTLSFIATQP